MFGHRKDGRKIKTLAPEFRLMPSIMKERSEALVGFKQDIKLKGINDYIAKKQEEGIKFSTMEVIIAAILRILATRPALNRFIMNGRTYARNYVVISITVKQTMTDDGDESTVKLYFKGNENIFDVKKKLEEELAIAKNTTSENSTDKAANLFGLVPTPLIKFLVGLVKILDKHGHLPKWLIKASPFHTSCYITNVGSLGIDSVYHHLYNFGTTSMFCAIGKKKKSYIYEDDEIHEEKVITLGFVVDERICDGFYFASSFKSLSRILAHPEVLEDRLDSKVEDQK